MPTRGGGISGSTLTSIAAVDTTSRVDRVRPQRTNGHAYIVADTVLTNNGGAIDLYNGASMLQVKQTRRPPLG